MQPQPDIEGLFNAARQLRDPGQRQAFLTAACAGQPDLRRRLDRLPTVQPEADDFFDRSSSPESPSLRAAPKFLSAGEEDLGSLLGRYKLLQKIGEGGCGIVYLAEQVEPVHRRVALKVIKLGMDTAAVIARFE